jgi:hypothetical protein
MVDLLILEHLKREFPEASRDRIPRPGIPMRLRETLKDRRA